MPVSGMNGARPPSRGEAAELTTPIAMEGAGQVPLLLGADAGTAREVSIGPAARVQAWSGHA